MQLRGFQQEFKKNILAEWAKGYLNVLAVLPTGAGKTVSFSDIVKDNRGCSCVIVHRQELLSQASKALARAGVQHRIISAASTVRSSIERDHRKLFKRSYVNRNAPVAVCGVDTLVNKTPSYFGGWAEQVTLWVQDEAHHVLKDNKWGKVTKLFPNARGLGVTATPLRADGKTLGRGGEGLFDTLVIGPNMSDLREGGYLTPYRIFAPPSDLDLSGLKVTGSGDVSLPQLKQRVQKSHIVGDIVDHYLRIAPGKLGATFVESIDTARNVALRFRDAGVPAEVISSKTPINIRNDIIRRFSEREVLQIVNVDILGEGFDLPALEVVSFGRYTESYGLFVQQFGRPLRPDIPQGMSETWGYFTDEERRHLIASGSKPHAIIIDHVGNCIRHGVPDLGKPWSLSAKKRRQKEKTDEIPLRPCLNPLCLRVYEAYKTACPYCSVAPEPAGRATPEQVDGDLVELDPKTLKELNSDIAKVDGAVRMPTNLSHLAMAGVKNNHLSRQKGQAVLRGEMTWWAGVQTALGLSIRESQKLFYLRFGVDVLTAQTLGGKELNELTEKVKADKEFQMIKHNFTQGGQYYV